MNEKESLSIAIKEVHFAVSLSLVIPFSLTGVCTVSLALFDE
jgi:hypothetical protein